jgi:hypothetical protein
MMNLNLFALLLMPLLYWGCGIQDEKSSDSDDKNKSEETSSGSEETDFSKEIAPCQLLLDSDTSQYIGDPTPNDNHQEGPNSKTCYRTGSLGGEITLKQTLYLENLKAAQVLVFEGERLKKKSEDEEIYKEQLDLSPTLGESAFGYITEGGDQIAYFGLYYWVMGNNMFKLKYIANSGETPSKDERAKILDAVAKIISDRISSTVSADSP